MNCSDVEIIHDSPDKISRNEVDATDSAEKIDGPDFSNKLDSALEPVTDRISFHRPQSPFSIKCSRPESPSTLQPLSSPGTPLLQLSVSNAIIGGQLGPLKAFGRGQGMEASAPIPTLSPVMKNSLLKSPNQISKSVDLHSSPPMINNDHSGLKATPPDNMSVDSNVATCSLSLQFDPEVLSRDVFVESCHILEKSAVIVEEAKSINHDVCNNSIVKVHEPHYHANSVSSVESSLEILPGLLPNLNQKPPAITPVLPVLTHNDQQSSPSSNAGSPLLLRHRPMSPSKIVVNTDEPSERAVKFPTPSPPQRSLSNQQVIEGETSQEAISHGPAEIDGGVKLGDYNLIARSFRQVLLERAGGDLLSAKAVTKSSFTALDTNKSGILTIKEVKDFLMSAELGIRDNLGPKYLEYHFDLLVEQIDVDRDGTISMHELDKFLWASVESSRELGILIKITREAILERTSITDSCSHLKLMKSLSSTFKIALRQPGNTFQTNSLRKIFKVLDIPINLGGNLNNDELNMVLINFDMNRDSVVSANEMRRWLFPNIVYSDEVGSPASVKIKNDVNGDISDKKRENGRLEDYHKVARLFRENLLDKADGNERNAKEITKKIFKSLDENNSGILSVQEVKDYLMSPDFGLLSNINDEEKDYYFDLLVEQIDSDRNGTVSLIELEHFLWPKLITREKGFLIDITRKAIIDKTGVTDKAGEDELLSVIKQNFNVSVRQPGCLLDGASFRKIFKQIQISDKDGGALNSDEVKAVLDSMDNNHDHVISLRELRAWLFPSHLVNSKVMTKLKSLIVEKFHSVSSFCEEILRIKAAPEPIFIDDFISGVREIDSSIKREEAHLMAKTICDRSSIITTASISDMFGQSLFANLNQGQTVDQATALSTSILVEDTNPCHSSHRKLIADEIVSEVNLNSTINLIPEIDVSTSTISSYYQQQKNSTSERISVKEEVKFIHKFTYVHPGRWMGFPYDVWNCCFTDSLICPKLQPKHIRNSEVITSNDLSEEQSTFIISEFRPKATSMKSQPSSTLNLDLPRGWGSKDFAKKIKTVPSKSSKEIKFDSTLSNANNHALFRGGAFRGSISLDFSSTKSPVQQSTPQSRHNTSYGQLSKPRSITRSKSSSPGKREAKKSSGNQSFSTDNSDSATRRSQSQVNVLAKQMFTKGERFSSSNDSGGYTLEAMNRKISDMEKQIQRREVNFRAELKKQEDYILKLEGKIKKSQEISLSTNRSAGKVTRSEIPGKPNTISRKNISIDKSVKLQCAACGVQHVDRNCSILKESNLSRRQNSLSLSGDKSCAQVRGPYSQNCDPSSSKIQQIDRSTWAVGDINEGASTQKKIKCAEINRDQDERNRRILLFKSVSTKNINIGHKKKDPLIYGSRAVHSPANRSRDRSNASDLLCASPISNSSSRREYQYTITSLVHDDTFDDDLSTDDLSVIDDFST